MTTTALAIGLLLGFAEPALSPNGTVRIDTVFVSLLEQVEVPAQEAGVLGDVMVKEGDLVEAGTLVARLDDSITKLELARAESELEVARDLAENDVSIRFSKKALAVAEAELRRANESVAAFQKAVSQTELDRLRLFAEKTGLEVEQAERNRHAAQLQARVKESELRLAAHKVERRQVKSPLSGVVVQVNRRPGEWVEPSETILRMVRVNRLRAEAFVPRDLIEPNMVGCKVLLECKHGDDPETYPGVLVFVSPEINPVNGQVRIWAEIENHDLKLRPGLQASMQITSEIAAPAGNSADADEGSNQ